MKYLIGNPIFSLIIGVVMVAGSKPIHSSPFDISTSTPTGGIGSQTSTPSGGTQSQTYTPSSIITQTQTFPPGPSNTPTQTFTPGPTGTNTPTTTLMPLPAVTLIFPVATGTLTPTKTPYTGTPAGTPDLDSKDEDDNIPPRFRMLSIVLIFLWLLLAGYLVVFIKHFR